MDFGAVLEMGRQMGADGGLLADVLPGVEAVLIAAMRADDGDQPDTPEAAQE
nr:hypothetical protein [Sphingosinithalassobacter tenebrarum]